MVSYSMMPHINAGNPKNLPKLDTFNIIFLNLGSDYSDELPECIRFPSAVFGNRLPEDRRKDILTNNYKIPKREYPKRELVTMNSIYEDTKRRFTREGGIEVGTTAVKSVMEKMDLSPEEAFDLLNIEGRYRQFIMDDLKKDGIV